MRTSNRVHHEPYSHHRRHVSTTPFPDVVPDSPSTGRESEILVGPVLRYTDRFGTATVFVETARSRRVSITTGDGVTTGTSTWSVHGHHYALVVLRALPRDRAVTYTVALDNVTVWPLRASSYPPSVVPPFTSSGRVRIAFGSCRELGSYDATGRRRWGADALVALAARLRGSDHTTWPDLVLHLGDQVYADEPSPEIRDRLRALHRNVPEEVCEEIQDFEEYTWLYQATWMHPAVRWLLSTVPSAMILDDHDLRDDWNTSAAWRREMERRPWWPDRVKGGLGTYWVYQHIGNVDPDTLEEDDLYRAVTTTEDPRDATAALDAFALRADREPETARWSFSRDIGDTRLVVVDSRCSRTLQPSEARAIVDRDEWDWLTAAALADPAPSHVLIASTLPVFLPYGVHHIEGWSEAIAGGAWGPPGRWLGERVRQGIDLEHWPAFRNSFDAMVELLGALVQRTPAPRSILLLSGDVHFSYTSRVLLKDHPETPTHIHQLVQSPLRNALPWYASLAFRFFHRKIAARLFRPLARSAGVTDPRVTWEFDGPLSFSNGLMMLDLTADAAHVAMDEAHFTGAGEEILVRREEHALTTGSPTAPQPSGR